LQGAPRAEEVVDQGVGRLKGYQITKISNSQMLFNGPNRAAGIYLSTRPTIICFILLISEKLIS